MDGVADRFDIPSVTVQRERNDHVIGVRGMIAVRHTAALTADRGDLCHLRKRLAADLSGICLEHKRIPFSEKGGCHNRYHRHGSQASRCRRDPFGARASGSLCVCVCVLYSLHQFIGRVNRVHCALIALACVFVVRHSHASPSLSFSIFLALISLVCTLLSDMPRIEAISLHVYAS